jgi:hypothetical protein
MAAPGGSGLAGRAVPGHPAFEKLWLILYAKSAISVKAKTRDRRRERNPRGNRCRGIAVFAGSRTLNEPEERNT